MQRAMSETERRRKKQQEFNKKKGIKPKTIVKAVADVLEGAYSGYLESVLERVQIAESGIDYNKLSPEKLEKQILKLEKKMYQHAQDLEFEQAAKLRDDIHRIRSKIIEI